MMEEDKISLKSLTTIKTTFNWRAVVLLIVKGKRVRFLMMKTNSKYHLWPGERASRSLKI